MRPILGVVCPKAEGNARNVWPRLQLCHIPQQQMFLISCRTVVFFLIHSSGSRKITVFLVLFPFSLVHLSTGLEIWLEALKELIWDSGTCWMHDGDTMLRIGLFHCFVMAFRPVTPSFCRFWELLWKILHRKTCTFNTTLVRHQSHLCTIYKDKSFSCIFHESSRHIWTFWSFPNSGQPSGWLRGR